MRRFILGAFAAAAMLACSQEQVLEVNRANDEITFSVVADNQTKADKLHCNNNLPEEFRLYAQHIYNGGAYSFIEGDKIIQYDRHEYLNFHGPRYWPHEGPVIFYAYYPCDEEHRSKGVKMNWSIGEKPTLEFTVEDNVRYQHDFLYAKKVQSKSDNSPVQLNFRHGLCQLVFQAKNLNHSLGIVIRGITVCNVAHTNTFTFPEDDLDYYGNTDGTVGAHRHGTDSEMGNQGTWAHVDGGTKDYEVKFDPVFVDFSEDEVYSLTTLEDEYGDEQNRNALLLLPQSTSALHPEMEGSYEEDSYFLVDCKIVNLPDRDPSTGDWKYQYVLFDGKAAIPAYFDWAQGKRYVYTFVFGNGNGGYIYPTPEPVLAPIDFYVTVDDFLEEPGDDHYYGGTNMDTDGAF